jgi:hypothetical protein
MAVVIELTPEQEEQLRDRAAGKGLREADYAKQIVTGYLLSPDAGEPSLWDTLSPEEWSRQTREWVQGHNHQAPVLSDYAVSREGIYEDHL